jgi:hypothetical protein
MADRSVETLLSELRRRYGDRLVLYGTSHLEAHGMAFRLEGVPAVFSVLTRDGTMPFGRFDVQIESYPPGDYLWVDEYEHDALLKVIADVDRGDWPGGVAG